MSAATRLLSRSEVRYGLVGIANTLFGLAVIYTLKWFGLGDILANAFGYACGLLLSFKLNSRWTFGFRGREGRAFVKFILVVGISYLTNLLTVMVGIHTFGINGYLAQALGVVPYTVLSYLGSRYFVFRCVKH